MTEAATHRLTWDDLPVVVRDRVGDVLGAPVCAHRSVQGGFSPSTAEVVTSRNGHRAFVKAVTAGVNEGSMRLNLQEAENLEHIPPEVPAARLVASFWEGPWFVLVIEAVEGSIPTLPWTPPLLDAVLETLDQLQREATPCPLPDVPSVPDLIGQDLRGFERVLAEPPEELDPWVRRHLDDLAAAGAEGIAALDGDTLCHTDLRADNLLVKGDGSVVIVDWAWAGRGSRVADALQLLASVEDADGALDLDARIDALMDRHGAQRFAATDVLAGILGFFVDAARRDTDPTMPTLGEHRRRSRDQLLPIVRRRWELEGRDRG
jgi:aminoglycoside phosphotransferase (APT) family kinase protein